MPDGPSEARSRAAAFGVCLITAYLACRSAQAPASNALVLQGRPVETRLVRHVGDEAPEAPGGRR